MATSIHGGPKTWSMERDSEGHRQYKLVYQVKGDVLDGPATVANTAGLPVPGAVWVIGNDVDLWAWCRNDAKVIPRLSGEPNKFWDVEFTFSTKPNDRNKQRCNDVPIEDPLLEPQKISGGFSRYTEEATVDRFGRPIVNSAFEQVRGPQVEFDANRGTLKIEQNVASLGIEVFSLMIDTVNIAPIWGLPRRCVKLSNVSWERKFYGQCFKYYTRTFEFDIDRRTFDRDILDEGTKVLHGRWGATGEWELRDLPLTGETPNPNNPAHFMRAVDREGNHIRMVLNGAGLPAATLVSRGLKFVSITFPNTGNALNNTSYWLPALLTLPDGITPGTSVTEADLPEWSNTATYPVGSIVKRTSGGGEVEFFVAKLRSTRANPIDPPTDAATWLEIPLPFFTGNYASGTTYEEGQLVNAQGATLSGNIHVEKYPESNFLLLGVPLVL